MVGSLFAGIVYKYTIQLSSEDNIDLSIADIYKGELEVSLVSFGISYNIFIVIIYSFGS